MKENKYDDSVFFEQYSHMPRSEQGLSAAGEWPALKALLPELAGKRVLDLGCGFGWHCRYAAEHGAARVLGTDLSQRMLERARAMTDSPVVEYRRAAIEDTRPAPAAWDVVHWRCIMWKITRACAAWSGTRCPPADGLFFRRNIRCSRPRGRRTGRGTQAAPRCTGPWTDTLSRDPGTRCF